MRLSNQFIETASLEEPGAIILKNFVGARNEKAGHSPIFAVSATRMGAKLPVIRIA
jgi:hypothetical protein